MMAQIVQAIQIYNVAFPANVEIYLEEVRKAINFEALKIDNLLSLVDRKSLITDFIESQKSQLTSNLSSSGYESGDTFFTLLLKQYAIIGVILALIACILFGLSLIPIIRKEVKK